MQIHDEQHKASIRSGSDMPQMESIQRRAVVPVSAGIQSNAVMQHMRRQVASAVESPAQRQAPEEEEPLQMQAPEEEEPLQMQAPEEEEPLQMQAPEEEEPLQMQEPEEEEPLQMKKNDTGLPDNLKSGVEGLSGMSLDDVKVHYNSPKPAEVDALAYTQGTDIHVAGGQEEHLAHEAWHVVQQAQGRVQPTMQMQDLPINDDDSLEREADEMGRRAGRN